MPAIANPKLPKESGVFEEHAIVELTHEFSTEGGVLPAGTRGVVHEAKRDGSTYLVEFDDPLFCVIEVSGGELHRG